MCRSKGIFALFFLQDGNPILGDCKVMSLSNFLTVAALNDLGYSIENCDESPGIYYENKGGITTSTNLKLELHIFQEYFTSSLHP